ncbi:MAG: hypothetical protein E6767_02160 [Dysgonomonas sp.]|nr:hypothetical protein [Dysgonomonas sp.]
MLYFKEELDNNTGALVFIYKGATIETLQNDTEMLMISLGYKHLGGGAFEKGSRALRLLFGAFCKYFKFNISFEQLEGDEVRMMLSKATTGVSGGIIGVNQVKNEFELLRKNFQTI